MLVIYDEPQLKGDDMNKILVSSCLLGQKVRNDGKDNLQTNSRLQEWIKSGKVISIFPEMAGGLPTPRAVSEIQQGKTATDVLDGAAKVITANGNDVTSEYLNGDRKTLALVQKYNIRVAILKARSPSCGSQKIYDGTFSGNKIDGMGITAALLSENGIHVFDKTQIDAALNIAKN